MRLRDFPAADIFFILPREPTATGAPVTRRRGVHPSPGSSGGQKRRQPPPSPEPRQVPLPGGGRGVHGPSCTTRLLATTPEEETVVTPAVIRILYWVLRGQLRLGNDCLALLLSRHAFLQDAESVFAGYFVGVVS